MVDPPAFDGRREPLTGPTACLRTLDEERREPLTGSTACPRVEERLGLLLTAPAPSFVRCASFAAPACRRAAGCAAGEVRPPRRSSWARDSASRCCRQVPVKLSTGCRRGARGRRCRSSRLLPPSWREGHPRRLFPQRRRLFKLPRRIGPSRRSLRGRTSQDPPRQPSQDPARCPEAPGRRP